MSNKAIFFDRDDTLIEDPGYINSPEQVKLLPGVSNSLIKLREMGYKLVIVTNQSAVARGIITEKVLGQIHQQLTKLLSQKGASIDRIYYCPFHPDGVIAKYRKQSDLRKPNPGMILAAAEEMDIDLKQSWVVGNSYSDVTAGVRAGCRTILIKPSIKPVMRNLGDHVPDKEAINIKEVVNIIKMFERKDSVSSKARPEHKAAEPQAEGKQETEPCEQPQTKQELTPEKQIQPEEPPDSDKTTRLLEEVVKYLKMAQRESMFDEFSWMKVIAGAAQVLVFFCLVLSLWFLLDHDKGADSVQTTLGYAIVFELMSIAFYMMRDRK